MTYISHTAYIRSKPIRTNQLCTVPASVLCPEGSIVPECLMHIVLCKCCTHAVACLADHIHLYMKALTDYFGFLIYIMLQIQAYSVSPHLLSAMKCAAALTAPFHFAYFWQHDRMLIWQQPMYMCHRQEQNHQQLATTLRW